MKALSIKQPFAFLIGAGIKDIENRTWQTKFRGRIYIHASLKPAYPFQVLPTSIFKEDQINSMPAEIEKIIKRGRHDVGAIIGEVDIVDCVINHPSIWASETHCLSKPIYNWVLANPVLYSEPILGVKGQLSFWEFEKPDYEKMD